MATMPKQFLDSNFNGQPDNHVGYKSLKDINDLGKSKATGLSGLARFEDEMKAAGLSALRIGDYCVVYRRNLKPVQMWH